MKKENEDLAIQNENRFRTEFWEEEKICTSENDEPVRPRRARKLSSKYISIPDLSHMNELELIKQSKEGEQYDEVSEPLKRKDTFLRNSIENKSMSAGNQIDKIAETSYVHKTFSKTSLSSANSFQLSNNLQKERLDQRSKMLRKNVQERNQKSSNSNLQQPLTMSTPEPPKWKVLSCCLFYMIVFVVPVYYFLMWFKD